MKHCALTILALLYVLSCHAQGYDEVVFEVRKPKPVVVKNYFYNNLPAWFQRDSYNTQNKTCVEKKDDTLFYYMVTPDRYNVKENNIDIYSNVNGVALCPIRLGQRDSIGFYFIGATLNRQINDTIWECFITRSGTSYLTPFCTYDTLITGIKRPRREDRFREQDTRHREAYMLDTNVVLNVGDTSYACVKVLVSYYSKQDRNRKKPFAGDGGWSYSRTYYYLRKFDFLPIKVEVADRVKKLRPSSPYTPDLSAFELYKAIE